MRWPHSPEWTGLTRFRMGMPLRLYSLSGDFKIVRTVEVKTIPEARAAVEAHIAGSGYTNLRTKDDDDMSLRFIADPPVGRKGRNVAALDL
jgi:hypothetical protein